MPNEREIGHQPLQLRVFFSPLPQLSQLAQPEPRILSLPQVERLLTDADLPTDLRHGCPALRLPQGSEHLFLGMSTSYRNNSMRNFLQGNCKTTSLDTVSLFRSYRLALS
jgi:hypothetical protein